MLIIIIIYLIKLHAENVIVPHAENYTKSHASGPLLSRSGLGTRLAEN